MLAGSTQIAATCNYLPGNIGEIYESKVCVATVKSDKVRYRKKLVS